MVAGRQQIKASAAKDFFIHCWLADRRDNLGSDIAIVDRLSSGEEWSFLGK